MRLRGGLRRLEFITAFVGAYADETLNAGGMAVALNRGDGIAIKHISRAVSTKDAIEAVYEGVVTALREAKALGAHRVAVFCDSEVVIAHLNGRLPVSRRLQRPFIQARRLMSKFTWAGVRPGNSRHLREVQRAAFAAASNAARRFQCDPHAALQLSFAV